VGSEKRTRDPLGRRGGRVVGSKSHSNGGNAGEDEHREVHNGGVVKKQRLYLDNNSCCREGEKKTFGEALKKRRMFYCGRGKGKRPVFVERKAGNEKLFLRHEGGEKRKEGGHFAEGRRKGQANDAM